MAMVELNTGCLTCLQPSGIHFLNVQSTENTSIEEALRKHFWFTEADFQLATICQSCWDQVNNFHQFYISVEDLYHSRQPVAAIVKPEPQADGYTFQVEAQLRKNVIESKPQLNFDWDHLEDDDVPMVSVQSVSEAVPVQDDPPTVVLPECSSTQYYNTVYTKEEPVQEKEGSELSYNDFDENELDDWGIILPKEKGLHNRMQEAEEDEFIKQHIRYICEKCEHESAAFRLYRKHARTVHRDSNPSIECCGKQYRTKSALLQHAQFTNDPDVFRCLQCDRRFEMRDHLRSHRNNVHNKKFKCDQCPKGFNKRHVFLEHMEDHKKIWKCKKCDKTLADEQSLLDHIREMHKKAKSCNVCKALLPDEDALAAHYMKEHEEYWDEHQGLLLDDSFHGAEDDHSFLREEEEDHDEEPLEESNDTSVELYQDFRVVISDCMVDDGLLERYGITAKYLESLTRALEEGNNYGYSRAKRFCPSFEDEYIRKHVQLICTFCGHDSTTFYHFKQHAIMTHDFRMPFMECCGKKFFERFMLFRHVQQVEDPSIQRKFKCTRCPKTLQTQYQLNVHMENHKREIYNCTRCHKVFSDVTSLGTHIMTCWSEASNCDICRLVLPNKAALDAHNAQAHSGIKTIPYVPVYPTRDVSENAQEKDLQRPFEQPQVATEVRSYEKPTVEPEPKVAENNDLIQELPACNSSKPDGTTEPVVSSCVVNVNDNPFDESMEQLDNKKGDSDPSGDDSSDCPEYTPAKRLVNAIDIASPAADKYIRKHVKFVCDECGQNCKTFAQFKLHSLKEHGIKSAFIECCGRKFFKKYNLMQHVQIIDNPDAFSCTHCHVKYKYREGLLKHLRKVHSTDWTKFKCDRCPETFADGNLAKLHMQGHKSCKCPLCGQRFPDVIALRAHAHLTHPGAILCYACKQVLSSQKALEEHQIQEHGMVLPAMQDTTQSQDSEDESLIKWVGKNSALASSSGVKPLQNFEVPLVTKREPGLVEDDSLLQPIPERPASASIDIKQPIENDVGKETDYRESEESADEEEDAVRPAKRKRRSFGLKSNQFPSVEDDYIREHVKYICKQCGVESKTFFDFKRHAQHVHQIKWSFVVCCGTEYAYRSRLYEHVQLVNNPDTFRCEECQRSFKNKPGYVRHMDRFHDSNDRRFKCDRCPKSFNYNYLYQEHMEQHVNPTEEGWQCAHCEKIFPGANHLDKHIYNVHPEAPKFICDICSKAFRVESWLQRHKMSHATHKCQLCPQELTDRISLRKHARSAHPDAMVCSICKHVLATRDALLDHKAREHGVPIKQQSQPVNDGGLIDEQGQPLESLEVVNVDQYQNVGVELPDALEDNMPEGYSIKTVIKTENLAVKVEEDTEEELSEEEIEQMDDNHDSEQHDEEQEEDDEDNLEFSKARRKKLEAGLTSGLLEDEYIRKHVQYICEHCRHESQSFSHYKQHSLWAHGKKSPPVECCGRKYYKKWILLQHVQNFNEPDNYRCEECDRAFTNEEGHRRHIKRYHAVRGLQFQCERCTKSFCYKHELKKHMQDHLGKDNKSWKCNNCQKLYASAFSLNNHMKREHGNVHEFICDVCSKGFHIESWLLEHKKLRHQKLQCLFCPQQFPNGKSYRSHVQEMHPDELIPMICNLCKQVFPTRVDLRAHKQQEHGSEGRRRQGFQNAEDVPKESVDESNMEKESEVDLLVVKTEAEVQYLTEPANEPIQSKRESEGSDDEETDDQDDTEYVAEQPLSRGVKPPGSRMRQDKYIKQHVQYNCEQCGHTSATFQLFLRHARKVHGIGSPFLECCGKKYHKKHFLYLHVQQLRNPVAFTCEVCNKDFKLKSYYQRHMKEVHPNEKLKYKCDQCPRALKTRYSLRLHKQNHAGQDNQSWKCQHCDRLHKSRMSLQTHIRKEHPGAPKYTCDVCSKQFCIELVFQRHKLTHKKLGCLRCPELYPDVISLRAHALKLHPNDEPPQLCISCRTVLPNKTTLKAHKAKEHQLGCNTSDEDDSANDSFYEWPHDKTEFDQHKNQQVSLSVKSDRLEDGLLGCSYSKSSSNTGQSGKSASGTIVRSSVGISGDLENVLELLSEDETAPNEVSPNLEREKALPEEHAGVDTCSKCELCGASFQTREALEYHLKNWHIDGPEFFCDICSAGFRMKIWLEQHKQTHEKLRTFKCDRCPESFTDKSLHESHVQEHEGWVLNNWNDCFEDPPDFICDHCSKAFRVEQFFEDHKLNHGSSAVQCGHCAQKFGDAKSMRAHVRQMHLGTKIVCKICNLYFPSADALQTHKVYSHGVKPLNQKCPYCRDNFGELELLNRHVATVHKGLKSGSLSEFLDM